MNRKACFASSVLLIISFAGTQVSGASSYAQAPPAGVQSSLDPAFDVVSIHPMKQDDNTPTHITNPANSGYFKAINVNLKALLEVACDIPDTRMLGGEGWLTTGKFFLEAKSDPKVDQMIASLSPEQGKQLKRKMLADLLADRFKTAVHTEAREMAVYALVIAKGGPKVGGVSAGTAPTAAGDERIEIRAGGNSLEILSYELSWRLGRPVLDQTGLQVRQALLLRWRDDGAAPADSNGPSLSTAMREQLGLKLESTKAAVPLLVIDHAERPTDN